jgi:molybdenum ABC transporter molybdate-binding protein
MFAADTALQRNENPMSSESAMENGDWTVGVRLWVDRGGRALLGPGRVELLEGIDRWHSISAAARAMKMSYRRAWLLVQSMNEAAGEALVEAAIGGSQGGGAHLTPLGRWAITAFRDVQNLFNEKAGPLAAAAAHDETIHVAAAVSLEEVLGQLLADYAESEPGVRVRVVYGASDELADRLLAGAPADLFLAADAQSLDHLEAAKRIDAGSRVLLARNTLAVIGADNQAIKMCRPSDLGRLEVGRIAVAQPSSPLGAYTRAFLESRLFYKTLEPHFVVVDNARAVPSAVRAGRAEIGFVYGSDAAAAEGCRILFGVRRLPVPIVYSAALVGRGRREKPARDLLNYLASNSAAKRFRHCGFLPAPVRCKVGTQG